MEETLSKAVAVYHGNFGRASIYHLDRPITTHAHREGHLIFQLNGPMSRVAINQIDHLVDTGYGLAINSWDPHAFYPPDHGYGADYLILYIKPLWFLQHGRTSKSTLTFGRAHIAITRILARQIAIVTNLLLDARGTAMFDGYLYELIRESFEQSWDAAPATLAGGRGINDFRVRKSIRLMSDNPTADLRLDRIAREAGLSRPHFYKLFRRQMGITPQLFMNTLLIERAIDQLIGTNISVTELSYELGFPSQSGFTRFFAANAGMAPSGYRRATQVLHS